VPRPQVRPGGSYPEAFARSRTRETADDLALQVGGQVLLLLAGGGWQVLLLAGGGGRVLLLAKGRRAGAAAAGRRPRRQRRPPGLPRALHRNPC
jgi:hypothetical protein